MEAAFTVRKEYLEVVLWDDYSFPFFFSLLDRIAEEGRRNDRTLVLIDTMRMAGMPEEIERFKLGVKASEVLRPPYVVLVLSEPEKINKFGETVAVNRGAIILATSDRGSGMAWLLNNKRKVPQLSGTL